MYQLKPCCVKISQIALAETVDAAASRELVDLSRELLDILVSSADRNGAGLDESRAEYVFFPLSHIFRQMDRYPMPLIENCLACLSVLVVYGWKSKISSKLVQQIFSLITFIIDGKPRQNNEEPPEETILEAFRVQNALLSTAATSRLAASGLADSESVPMLGHGVTVMLDAAVDGITPAIQSEAIDCVSALYKAIRDQEALASFLPGTISAFAKLLSTPSRYKNIVLAKCLEAVKLVLVRVLADMRTRLIPEKDPAEGEPNKLLSRTWLEATSSQIKLALSPMMKLRKHDSDQVLLALERLCITLLDECHDSLKNCASFLVETAIILDPGSSEDFSMETNLAHLVRIYPELEDAVKNTVYNWMISLPRIMQSADRDAKVIAVHDFLKGIEMLQSLNIQSTIIDDSLPSTLRDTVMSIMGKDIPSAATISDVRLSNLSSTAIVPGTRSYPSVLLAHDSQRELKTEIQKLINIVGKSSDQEAVLSGMLEVARSGAGENQIASYWLCFQTIKASHALSVTENEFLNLASFDGSNDIEPIFDELYSYSVQVLDNHSDALDLDWRLEAIALEITAYAAQRAGAAFRPELIDVLFPIATFLGSDNSNLQQHAIVTLNSIASSCDYGNVSELIISNVDYMVNSVSLRLNTLDISPASTQVLTMMIRLAGPRLIPFLDDVVDSIFAALDNYHGYPAFVESLFAVLKELVDQAVRADKLMLIDREQDSKSHKKQSSKTTNIQTLLKFLGNRRERIARDQEELEHLKNLKSHPKRPWSSKDEDKDEEMADNDGRPPPEEEKPPNSPTYQLLNRVANLTQYYLTSPTPKLRRSLLELLTTAAKVLAADEDAFLPLVNSLWPVVITRLHDSESFIVIEACHTLSGFCEAAGDFLSSRFKTEWNDGLRDWCRRMKRNATTSIGYAPRRIDSASKSKDVSIPVYSDGQVVAKATTVEARPSGGLGQHASPARIWEAVIKLLTSIVTYVQIDAGMFDDILELLADALEKSQTVREALEAVNGDAVWLLRYERGMLDSSNTPLVPGFTLAPLAKT